MTDELTKLIAELRGLRNSPHVSSICPLVISGGHLKGADGVHLWTFVNMTHFKLAKLIVAAINALSTLLDALEAQEKRVAELEAEVARLRGLLPTCRFCGAYGELLDGVCVDCGCQGCWGQCRIREEVWRKREINAGLSEPPEPEQKADAAD